MIVVEFWSSWCCSILGCLIGIGSWFSLGFVVFCCFWWWSLDWVVVWIVVCGKGYSSFWRSWWFFVLVVGCLCVCCLFLFVFVGDLCCMEWLWLCWWWSFWIECVLLFIRVVFVCFCWLDYWRRLISWCLLVLVGCIGIVGCGFGWIWWCWSLCWWLGFLLGWWWCSWCRYVFWCGLEIVCFCCFCWYFFCEFLVIYVL